MSSYDVIVRGGTIVDGTRMPRFVGDLGIRNGIIEKISGEIRGSAAREIDASGKIVAPGVIDPHTHYDAQVHWDPNCTNSSWHGATTVVVSNCGFGFAPCKAADREQYMLMMENTEQVPVNAMRTALGWEWETFPEWMRHMRDLPKGVNMASYLPLNSLMIYVMGYEAAKSRPATKLERQKMRDALHEAMDCGAIGFALSHLNQSNSHKDCDGTAMPTDEMAHDDIFNLADVLRERGEGVIQCLAEIPGVIANRGLVEELAKRSKRPVLHNIITAFDFAPEAHREELRWLDRCEAEGLTIYSQAFSFRAWNEFQVCDFNAWQHVPLFNTLSVAKGADGKAALCRDADFRERARAEYDPALMYQAGGPIETFRLHRAKGAARYAEYEGLLIGEIAERTSQAPIDIFFDIIADSEAIADFKTSEAASWDPDKLGEILNHKRVCPGTSDGGAHVKFHAGGQYPSDLISWMSRDLGRVTLEDAHFKLSNMPARILGLHGRGVLTEGAVADIYSYDLQMLDYDLGNYEIAHDLPGGDWRRVCRARGVDWVMVNGETILHDGEATGATPGRMVCNTGREMDARLAEPSAIAAE